MRARGSPNKRGNKTHKQIRKGGEKVKIAPLPWPLCWSNIKVPGHLDWKWQVSSCPSTGPRVARRRAARTEKKRERETERPGETAMDAERRGEESLIESQRGDKASGRPADSLGGGGRDRDGETGGDRLTDRENVNGAAERHPGPCSDSNVTYQEQGSWGGAAHSGGSGLIVAVCRQRCAGPGALVCVSDAGIRVVRVGVGGAFVSVSVAEFGTP